MAAVLHKWTLVLLNKIPQNCSAERKFSLINSQKSYSFLAAFFQHEVTFYRDRNKWYSDGANFGLYDGCIKTSAAAVSEWV